MIAEVLINTNAKELNNSFDYEVPNDMKVKLGDRVFVPFGKGTRVSEGIVIGFKEKSEFEVKPIAKVEEGLGIDENLIKMAQWMAKRYFCNTSDCIRLMLQPGTTSKNIELRVKERKINVVELVKSKEEIIADIDNKTIRGDKQIKVLQFVMDNENASIKDIALFTDATLQVVKNLKKKGYLKINAEKVLRNPFINHVAQKKSTIKLTDEQKRVISSIDINEHNKYLIYGVTGSRKNWSLFAINWKNFKSRKVKHYFGSGDFTYATNN